MQASIWHMHCAPEQSRGIRMNSSRVMGLFINLFLAAFFAVTIPQTGFSETISLDVDEVKVRAWNRFAGKLVSLHEQGIANREIRTSEDTGRFGGERAKGFTYREVSYHDAKSGRLLSRIRRDAEKPDNIQQIDVLIYDSSGRVIRDYTAIYLPWGRHAPISTFINLHQHGDDIHGFRQFDASGNRLYEQCRGKFAGRNVDLSLEDYQIDSRVTESEAYQACFGKLPQTADDYLIPH
jgi:hypothetical protein